MEAKCSRELVVHVKVEPMEETNREFQEVTSSPEHIIKTEPPWPAWAAAAMAEERGGGGGGGGGAARLYADHVVKGELVLGPERLHRPGGALLASRKCLRTNSLCTMPADRDSGQQPHLALKDCTVRLERIPYNTLLARTVRTSKMEEIDYIYNTDSEIPYSVGITLSDTESIEEGTHTGFDSELPCYVCSKRFTHKSYLMKHIAIHIYNPSSELDGNVIQSDTEVDNEVHACDICGKIFDLKLELMEHVVSHIYVQEECEVNAPPPAARAARAAPACPAGLERCDAVPSDSQQKTNKGIQHTYACDTCGKAFDEKVVLVRHIRAHAQEKYSKKSKFDTSKGSKTGKLYDREICNEKFPKKHNVIEHKFIQSGKKAYSCNKCGKQFTRKDSLTKHLLIHTGQKPYCCEICKRRFVQKCSLMRHKAFIHRDMISEDKWRMTTMKGMCTICNKPFVDLKTHIVIHTGEKPYFCDICQKEFTQKCAMITHKRIHTGEKPYFCDICQKQFTQNSTMIAHKRIHTGERPYCCNVCVKKFRKSSDLYRHERLHTGKKPYSCEICKRKFYRSEHLIGHKKAHLNPRKKRGRPGKTNLDQVNDDDVLPDASADGDILTKSVRKSISGSYDTGPTEG